MTTKARIGITPRNNLDRGFISTSPSMQEQAGTGLDRSPEVRREIRTGREKVRDRVFFAAAAARRRSGPSSYLVVPRRLLLAVAISNHFSQLPRAGARSMEINPK
jgi:hypothetical protein